VSDERRRDGARLTATRGIRGFVDGAVSVVLSAYLTLLGYSGKEIGIVVTAMLLGSAALTLLAGTYGHRFRRRTILLAGAVLMITTGSRTRHHGARSADRGRHDRHDEPDQRRRQRVLADGTIAAAGHGAGQPAHRALCPLCVRRQQSSAQWARSPQGYRTGLPGTRR